MPGNVVEASAIGAMVFGEAAADEIAAKRSGATLAAPALLAFEVANVAVKKLRRHPEQRAALPAAHALSLRVSIETVAAIVPPCSAWLRKPASPPATRAIDGWRVNSAPSSAFGVVGVERWPSIETTHRLDDALARAL